jgi:large subunit ribosomal protein L18
MNVLKKKNIIQARRVRRTRAPLEGTASRPRLSVYKSNSYLYVQLIDDVSGTTIVSAHTKQHKPAIGMKAAVALGSDIAKKASEKNITQAVFDRGPYRFHGMVKAVADAAREGGLLI